MTSTAKPITATLNVYPATLMDCLKASLSTLEAKRVISTGSTHERLQEKVRQVGHMLAQLTDLGL